jgi:hypothetical protein
MHVSLVRGAVPLVVGVTAVSTLAASVIRRGMGWLTTVIGQVAVAIAVMAAVNVAIRWSGVLPYRFPRSFYAWWGVTVFAALVARAGWRGASGGRRLASVAAVATSAALAAILINLHYDFYPTLGSVFGPVSADQATRARLAELESRVRAAGQLPQRGAVLDVDPPATVSRFPHRAGFVYVPPVWFAKPRPPLPAVLMIAGEPGLPSDWIRAGLADRTADRFAAAHGGRAPVLVFADQNGSDLGDTECVDGPRGNAETYLTVDVRRWAVGTLGVSAAPGRWAVAGLSEGGTCALTLTLRHPDLFQTFADFSGELAPSVVPAARTLPDLFGGSATALHAHEPLSLLTHRSYSGLAGWFEVGENDPGPVAAARRLVPAAQAAGIDTRLVTRPGVHNFAFWSSALDDALPWLAARLGLLR